jgi:hypothetical protein
MYKILSREELLSRYAAGERDFLKVVEIARSDLR